MNLGPAFSVRLFAPNTGSLDIATYYMTAFLCESSRALLERAIEGGFNFADCVITPDGCTMINRCVENMELLHTMGRDNPHFFHEYMEIPLKADENGLGLYVLQCRNHVLTPLQEHYGIDISDAAIRKAVAEHNRVCELIRAIGEFRKEERPRITGYEFHVLTLATYVCPKALLIDRLEETLEELHTREPDRKACRARVALVGSEVDDVGLIKLIEETGAYVCADRFCFGSLPGRDPIVLTEEEDALTQVCRQYMYRCQCPRMMNMEKVYGRKEYVSKIAKEYRADGVIYEQVKFCDPGLTSVRSARPCCARTTAFPSCLWTGRITWPRLPARCARACRPLWKASRSRRSRKEAAYDPAGGLEASRRSAAGRPVQRGQGSPAP